MLFIDGDFPTGATCKHHCSPTCHPGQVGEGWRYGCLHQAWPQNRGHDFCPLVTCDGDPKKCEIPARLLKRFISGRKRRVSNALKKAKRFENERKKAEYLLMKTKS